VAERGGEVEVRVRIARQGEVGVVEEVRVRLEDAAGEQRVVGMDCAPEADGGVDPAAIVNLLQSNGKISRVYTYIVVGDLQDQKIGG
jgi:hypothetical protein